MPRSDGISDRKDVPNVMGDAKRGLPSPFWASGPRHGVLCRHDPEDAWQRRRCSCSESSEHAGVADENSRTNAARSTGFPTRRIVRICNGSGFHCRDRRRAARSAWFSRLARYSFSESSARIRPATGFPIDLNVQDYCSTTRRGPSRGTRSIRLRRTFRPSYRYERSRSPSMVRP